MIPLNKNILNNASGSSATSGLAGRDAGSTPIGCLAPLLRSDDTDKTLRCRLAGVYAVSPRREQHHNGKPIPTTLRDRLLDALRELRWPAKRHRTSVRAISFSNGLMKMCSSTRVRRATGRNVCSCSA